jgi:hypothetical protein
MDPDPLEAGDLTETGRRWLMDRFGMVPVDAGARSEARIAAFVLGRFFGGFYVDRGEASYLTVLIAAGHGPVMIAGLRDAEELAARITTCPELTEAEVDELLEDLDVARVAR